MMTSSSSCLALLCLLAVVVSSQTVTHPLPMFRAVETDTTITRDSARIKVAYLSPSVPNITWYVDDFPIPDHHASGFVKVNDYDVLGTAILNVPDDKGRRFKVCLQNRVGKTCLKLKTLPLEMAKISERVEFPWPVLVPAPLARYHSGRNVKVLAYDANTPHSYNYTARFVSRDPVDANGAIVKGVSHGQNGGEPDDVISIAPKTTGRGGYMVTLNTQKAHYEGELLLSVTFTPPSSVSQLVESCTSTRPITFYERSHEGPFTQGFVAMVEREHDQVWGCREFLDCHVVCPFVSNGDVNATLSRMPGRAELLPQEKEGKVLRLGDYYGEAIFVIRSFNPLTDSGTYVCGVNSATKSVIMPIEIFDVEST